MKPSDLLIHYRTQAEAADELGMSKQTVSHWLKTGSIPLKSQIQIEVKTDGKLKADLSEHERAVIGNRRRRPEARP
jgi:transcriptional regulator with XRE-family HTH domain